MKHFLTKATEYAMGTNCPYVWDTYCTPKNILKMTAKQKAEQLINEFLQLSLQVDFFTAKQCAIIAVRNIMAANPHSNPFNTDIYSTLDWWIEVYNELNKDQ